ncbi:MAG: hypothetical protein JWL86_3595 [Rhizobium sp.]|nr:hypothetical protein [Rhizobium sp.]
MNDFPGDRNMGMGFGEIKGIRWEILGGSFRGAELCSSKINLAPSSISKTHLSVHARVSAPWFDHARLPIPSLGAKDRPGHVSVPDYMTAFAAVKTRCRAPLNGVSIPELASTAPVIPQPLRSFGKRSCVRYSARPGRNSAFRLPSPEDWPFSRTSRMETCVASPCRSPVPPRPGAPGCSRCGTG